MAFCSNEANLCRFYSMQNKKKECMGSNGVSYCPFLVFVSRQEGRDMHNRRVCEHDQGLVRARAC